MPVNERIKLPLSDQDTTDTDENVVPLSGNRSLDSLKEAEAALSEETPARRSAFAISSHGIWLASKYLAGGLLVSWLLAWPIGTTMVHQAQTGVFAIRLGFSVEVLLLAVTTSALVLAAGYALAAGFRLEAAARRLTQTFTQQTPASRLADQKAAQQQVTALNAEIDRALSKLAEAESIIRQQVKAIDSAGAALESGTIKSAERLESERTALISLTEEMNKEADRFADKIAERTRLATEEKDSMAERLLQREEDFDTQLERLEAISRQSLERYEHLAQAMGEHEETLSAKNNDATERQTALASQLEENTKRIETAQSELSAQSKRLEELMQEQRQRADRLAKAVTEQAEKLANSPAPAPEIKSTVGDTRRGLAWRDILATVEDALPVQKTRAETPPAAALSAAPQQMAEEQAPGATVKDDVIPNAVDRLINRVQNFSLVVHTQLYGGPSHGDLDRFENGERQIFARALLTKDPGELKDRIARETDQNEVFGERVREFLRDFDTLLEPLSADEGGEEAIESYLTSPIGRLYVLTGTAVDHFSN